MLFSTNGNHGFLRPIRCIAHPPIPWILPAPCPPTAAAKKERSNAAAAAARASTARGFPIAACGVVSAKRPERRESELLMNLLLVGGGRCNAGGREGQGDQMEGAVGTSSGVPSVRPPGALRVNDEPPVGFASWWL